MQTQHLFLHSLCQVVHEEKYIWLCGGQKVKVLLGDINDGANDIQYLFATEGRQPDFLG